MCGQTRGLQHCCPCWGSCGTLTPSLPLQPWACLRLAARRPALPHVAPGRPDTGMGGPAAQAATGHGNGALSTCFLTGTKYSLSLPKWDQTLNPILCFPCASQVGPGPKLYFSLQGRTYHQLS